MPLPSYIRVKVTHHGKDLHVTDNNFKSSSTQDQELLYQESSVTSIGISYIDYTTWLTFVEMNDGEDRTYIHIVVFSQAQHFLSVPPSRAAIYAGQQPPKPCTYPSKSYPKPRKAITGTHPGSARPGHAQRKPKHRPQISKQTTNENKRYPLQPQQQPQKNAIDSIRLHPESIFPR